MKYVYFFGDNQTEGKAEMRTLLGSKGAVLAEISSIGMPVPPGFTITTESCNEYYRNGTRYPKGLDKEIDINIAKLEKAMNAKLGSPKKPLLLSVKSGAAVSMPGMMDAVLNLGLNDNVIEGIIAKTGNARFAWDIYRRFIDMFGDVVMGCHHNNFEAALETAKKKANVKFDNELSAEQLKGVVEQYKAIYKKEVGKPFPQDGKEQLTHAINAVLKSWMVDRAIKYRQLNNITGLLGTAVNIQAMVFGNMGNDCGTGVCFTRNPSTGKKEFYGEYLINAQGEDVVAGIRTPQPLGKLKNKMPNAYKQLTSLMTRLEKHYKDMQDVEFVIQKKKIYLLQTRKGKRTAYADLKFAIDFLDEKLISEREAVFRIQPDDLALLFAPRLPSNLQLSPLGHGLPASAGVGSGFVVFDVGKAILLKEQGKKVVFIKTEMSPEDIDGINVAEAIITLRGGMTSHAAMICRGMHKPCVAGVSELKIDFNKQFFKIYGQKIKEGDLLTVDGYSGNFYVGEIPFIINYKDDIYLSRYVSLVRKINSDDYIEKDLGKLWLLRDIIREKKLPNILLPKYSKIIIQKQKTKLNQIKKYFSFTQPDNTLIYEIIKKMHQCNETDIKTIILSTIDHLIKLSQSSVGIGNHYQAIRPLIDPQRAVLNLNDELLDFINHDQCYQLVGIEYFCINRLLRNYIPWGCLQIWFLASVESAYQSDFWKLDRTNPKGESLSLGSIEIQKYLFVLDKKCLSVLETKNFYNELRRREYKWDWYEKNNTTWREIRDTIVYIYKGKTVAKKLIKKCQKLGLVTNNLKLAESAYSLVLEQNVSDRKDLTFLGEKIQNE